MFERTAVTDENNACNHSDTDKSKCHRTAESFATVATTLFSKRQIEEQIHLSIQNAAVALIHT